MSLIETLLEKYLAAAREGHFTGIAISATGPGGFQHHYTGDTPDEPKQLKSVLALADRLQASIDNWQPYATDWSLDESYACYHTGMAPNGFDFLTWLLANEMFRRNAGAPAPLKVAFWQGHEPVANTWIDSVYRPALGLIGAVEDRRALQRMGAEIYLTKALVNMHNLGMAIPKLKAKQDYDLPKDVITITLREAEHWQHRNSDLGAWATFGNTLKIKGERVVFVRDTAKADEPFYKFETCPQASRDLDARMWLYENAKLNMFVSNGPMMLSVFSDKPFIIFTPPESDDSKYIPNHPLFWHLKMGVDVGDQFPWSRHDQRIIWKQDSLSAIEESYGCQRPHENDAWRTDDASSRAVCKA